jgi:hypothetical protein
MQLHDSFPNCSETEMGPEWKPLEGTAAALDVDCRAGMVSRMD